MQKLKIFQSETLLGNHCDGCCGRILDPIVSPRIVNYENLFLVVECLCPSKHLQSKNFLFTVNGWFLCASALAQSFNPKAFYKPDWIKWSLGQEAEPATSWQGLKRKEGLWVEWYLRQCGDQEGAFWQLAGCFLSASLSWWVFTLPFGSRVFIGKIEWLGPFFFKKTNSVPSSWEPDRICSNHTIC